MLRPALLLLSTLSACNWIGGAALDEALDRDGDGIPAESDCAPDDPAASVEQVVFRDADGDGLGNAEDTRVQCGAAPPGWSTQGGDDCDDEPDLIRPVTYYTDADGDGFGDPESPVEACAPEPPAGLSDREDCDDTNPAVSGLVEWAIDADGDGYGGPVTAELCAEVPPFGYADGHDDCDDADDAVNPGAQEVCGPIDEDCDGLLDEDPDIAGQLATWLPDADGDGFGDEAALLSVDPTRCPDPGTVLFTGDADCNDADDAISPAALEACDGLDNNCNDEVDEDFAIPLYYADADADGAPDPLVTQGLCVPQPGWIAASDYPDATALQAAADCDDTNPAIHPSAAEVFGDGIDQDCDPLTEWDEDGDGFTLPGAPTGQEDCDDSDAAINPAAVEQFYDGVDDDCDPTNDDDADGDGESAASEGGLDCDDADPTVNTAAVEIFYDDIDNDCSDATSDDDQDLDGEDTLASGGTDCDDLNAAVNASATEVFYDDIDNDCDPTTDDDDLDGDGFLAASEGGLDCDDTDAAVFPGALEVYYDGIDQDCDPSNDDDRDGDTFPDGIDCDDSDATIFPGAVETYYDTVDNDCDPATADGDQDADGVTATVMGGTDCDDTDPAVFPGAFEVPDDGIDNNCDPNSFAGVTCFADLDDDGFGAGAPTSVDLDVCFGGLAATDDDCDDLDASIGPGVVEVCDGLDANCDGIVDDGLITLFGDGPPVDLTPQVGSIIALEATMGADLRVNICGDDSAPIPVSFTANDNGLQTVALQGLKPTNRITRATSAVMNASYGNVEVTIDNLDYVQGASTGPGVSSGYGPAITWRNSDIELGEYTAVFGTQGFMGGAFIDEVRVEDCTVHSSAARSEYLISGSYGTSTISNVTFTGVDGGIAAWTFGRITLLDVVVEDASPTDPMILANNIDTIVFGLDIQNSTLRAPVIEATDAEAVVYDFRVSNTWSTDHFVTGAAESNLLVFQSGLSTTGADRPFFRVTDSDLLLSRFSTRDANSNGIAEILAGTLSVNDSDLRLLEARPDTAFVARNAIIDIVDTDVHWPMQGVPNVLDAEQSSIRTRNAFFGATVSAPLVTPPDGIPAFVLRESDIEFRDSYVVAEVCEDGSFPPCSGGFSGASLVQAVDSPISVFGSALMNGAGPVIEAGRAQLAVGDVTGSGPWSTTVDQADCTGMEYVPDGAGGGARTALDRVVDTPRFIGPSVSGTALSVDAGFCAYGVPQLASIDVLGCGYPTGAAANIDCDQSGCVCGP